MSQIVSKTCPICNEDYENNKIRELESGVIIRVDCERCGTYDIDKELMKLPNKPWNEVSHLVSAWVRRQNKSSRVPILGEGGDVRSLSSPEWWISRFRQMGFPNAIDEKLDELLLAYADEVKKSYKQPLFADSPHLVAEIAAESTFEVKDLSVLLDELGYLQRIELDPKDEQYREDFGDFTLTANGWLRIEELRKTKTLSDSAFIAMWFSDATKNYRQAVTAAVEICGFRPIIVDQEEYSDFIMDKVISLLKQAKFVIADFTCKPEEITADSVKNGVRGGVYWESGMAYGLGKPLIHTCEDTPESKARIHFDVDQYNTIYWKQDDLDMNIRQIEEANENPTFAEKLVARILALVGQGSYKPE